SSTTRPSWTTSKAEAFFASASFTASANAPGAMPSATGSGTARLAPGTASLGWYQATSRMLFAGWLRILEMYVHSAATKTPTAARASRRGAPRIRAMRWRVGRFIGSSADQLPADQPLLRDPGPQVGRDVALMVRVEVPAEPLGRLLRGGAEELLGLL